MNLTPKEIVRELDRYIIGQQDAKKAVAVALRNRYRRNLLSADIKEEVVPKNILMIGPTGVGKTEIARRLAKLASAPFIKVEVSKFTEVGYVGRDVDSMIRDLVETAIRMIKTEQIEHVSAKAELNAQERLLDYLLPAPKKSKNPFNLVLQGDNKEENEEQSELETRLKNRRERLRDSLIKGELDDKYIEIDVQSDQSPMVEIFSGAGVEEMGVNLSDLFGGMFPKKRKKRKVIIGEAKEILTQEEAQKLIDMEEIASLARQKVEQSGIVFLDEIDKIAGAERSHGPDVSREGVQRDILPVVEGSTVVTKYGPVRTDHILFIAAGAFHIAKPSDLIPELQGRFPIRVELQSLSEQDFIKILTEPDNALIKQYIALLATEDLTLKFSDDAILVIANLAQKANEQLENIGARRLHTMLEKLLENVSFMAPEMAGSELLIDGAYVKKELAGIISDKDLSRYIL